MSHKFVKYLQPEPGESVTRRVIIPADILKELKQERLNDERPYTEQPTVHDMAIQLIERGIKLYFEKRVEFYPINTKQGNATTVFYFVPSFYKMFEDIKAKIEAGEIEKTGAGAVSILHVILCLMRAGFEAIYPDKVQAMPLEITNLDAEKEERLAAQMAVNTDRL